MEESFILKIPGVIFGDGALGTASLRNKHFSDITWKTLHRKGDADNYSDADEYANGQCAWHYFD